MLEKKYLAALAENVLNFDFEGVKKTAEAAMQAGINPVTAIVDGLAKGLNIVQEKFENGEYFLSELVLAAEVTKDGMNIILPYVKGKDIVTKGKVMLATVEGDNHDIGKSIVATLLRVAGFDVIDLGIDVSTDTIVNAVKKHSPQILGLSSLLTVTMPEMETVINELKTTGHRQSIKVIVGGSPVTEEFAEKIGADYRAIDATDGVKKCIEWVS